MAILQAILRLITRSLGTALNTVFGWAVIALFGQTTPREQTVLSGLVAAAAAWPLLALGAIFPRLAVFVLAFVPLPKSVPPGIIRAIWIVLAAVLPLVVGIVVAARGSEKHLPEPWWKRLARGFPITLALAAAFLLMMVIAPIVKIASIVRRREVVRVPALMEKGALTDAADALVTSLREHGILLAPRKVPWHLAAPSRILLKIGGRAFASIASERIEYRWNPSLAISVLPNETVLDGSAELTGRAHAVCTEVFGPRRVIQTFSSQARDLEARIQRIWSIYLENPQRHRDSHVLRVELAEIAAELTTRTLPWDEHQIIYRLLLQLDRALAGKPPLLEKVQGETSMSERRIEAPDPLLTQLSNRELLKYVASNATDLAKREIELAKAELRQDFTAELAMAKGLGVSAVCALCTLNLLLVSVVFALARLVPDWAAALIVAAGVLLVGTVAGLVGWKKRVSQPFAATRRTLTEDARWAKQRLA